MSKDTQIELTKEGEEKLKKELNVLINVERPKIIEAITAARALGDLKENADYDAARNRQGEVEGRINEIQTILENAKIIKENKNAGSIVGIGSTVTIKTNKGEETYTIVGKFESDPANKKISNECPLGKALDKHKEGDEVLVKCKKEYSVKILKIKKN